MIYLAMNDADHLVKDSYYVDGMTINRQLDRDVLARKLGVEARIDFDAKAGSVVVTLSEIYAERLVIELFHPTDNTRDLKMSLAREIGNENIYHGDLGVPLNGRWYLELRDGENNWRLHEQVILPATGPVIMKPMAL